MSEGPLRTTFGVKWYGRNVTSKLGSLKIIHIPVFRYVSEIMMPLTRTSSVSPTTRTFSICTDQQVL